MRVKIPFFFFTTLAANQCGVVVAQFNTLMVAAAAATFYNALPVDSTARIKRRLNLFPTRFLNASHGGRNRESSNWGAVKAHTAFV